MPRTDPSLLALGRILRLVSDLAPPERDYLIARLSQVARPVTTPAEEGAARANAAEPGGSARAAQDGGDAAPVRIPGESRGATGPGHSDDTPARGFDLVDTVDGTVSRVGGR